MHGHAGRAGELGEEGLSGGLVVLFTDICIRKNLSTAVQIISNIQIFGDIIGISEVVRDISCLFEFI